MRASRIAVLAVMACLASAVSARAGLYTTTEKAYWPLPSSQYRLFAFEYSELRSIPVATIGPPEQPQPNRIHEAYQQKMADLEAKERNLGLTAEDRVNLSYYYLRLASPDKPQYVSRAVAVLEAVPRNQRNFMVLSNLSTAYQMEGQLDRAIDYLVEARRAWPDSWPGLTGNQLAWLYRAETFQLRLLRHRKDEARRAGGGMKQGLTLDPLFPEAKLSSAPFHAGWLPPKQAAELPHDAVNIVVQLLLWQPFDNALYWQLGEVLNARGDVETAFNILDDLSFNRGGTAAELRKHREVLAQAREALGKERNALAQLTGPKALQALTVLAPPSPLGVPVGGQVAQQLCREAAAQEMERRARTKEEEQKTSAPQEGPPSASRAKDLGSMVVAFVFGAAVATLAGMQYREMRRRRQEAAAASRG